MSINVDATARSLVDLLVRTRGGVTGARKALEKELPRIVDDLYLSSDGVQLVNDASEAGSTSGLSYETPDERMRIASRALEILEEMDAAGATRPGVSGNVTYLNRSVGYLST